MPYEPVSLSPDSYWVSSPAPWKRSLVPWFVVCNRGSVDTCSQHADTLTQSTFCLQRSVVPWFILCNRGLVDTCSQHADATARTPCASLGMNEWTTQSYVCNWVGSGTFQLGAGLPPECCAALLWNMYARPMHAICYSTVQWYETGHLVLQQTISPSLMRNLLLAGPAHGWA